MGIEEVNFITGENKKMIMVRNKKKLTLSQQVMYQIRVPGAIDMACLDWDNEMTATVETAKNKEPTTMLTITADQAALQGMLQHLYSLGLPLISVIWIENMER